MQGHVLLALAKLLHESAQSSGVARRGQTIGGTIERGHIEQVHQFGNRPLGFRLHLPVVDQNVAAAIENAVKLGLSLLSSCEIPHQI